MTNVQRDWKEFWNEFSVKAYDYVTLLPEYKRMVDKIVKSVGNNKKVLDAGCGTGNLTLKLARNNEVTAIDYSPTMLKVATEKTKNFDNVLIKQGDVTALLFEDKSFDIVVSVNVLFNLDNPGKAILEAKRVLKDNGILIISTPSKNTGLNKEFMDKVFADAKKGNIGIEKIMKLKKFNKILFEKGGMNFVPTRAQILELLDNGFEIMNIEKIYYGTNFLIRARKTTE